MAKPVAKYLIFLWVIFALFWIFADFSFIAFIILAALSYLWRLPRRECGAPGKTLSPIDGEVLKIFADEDERKLCVLLKTTLPSSTILCAPVDCESITIKQNHKPRLSEFARNGCTYVGFNDVELEIYPRHGRLHLLERYYELARSNCFGHIFSAYVLVVLPYESRLEIGLGDKIKAASVISRIE